MTHREVQRYAERRKRGYKGVKRVRAARDRRIDALVERVLHELLDDIQATR